jgi:hypothetical protein
MAAWPGGSVMLGGVVGAAVGFLLNRLGVVRLPVAVALGASAGGLLVVALAGIRRRKVWHALSRDSQDASHLQ